MRRTLSLTVPTETEVAQEEVPEVELAVSFPLAPVAFRRPFLPHMPYHMKRPRSHSVVVPRRSSCGPWSERWKQFTFHVTDADRLRWHTRLLAPRR